MFIFVFEKFSYRFLQLKYVFLKLKAGALVEDSLGNFGQQQVWAFLHVLNAERIICIFQLLKLKP